MSAQASITRAVVRSHVGSVIAAAVAIVLVGSVVATQIVVHRDDAASVALAHTLGSELTDHEREPKPALDELVVHELQEQLWHARQIEVWRGAERLGGETSAGTYGAWATAKPGCESAQVAASWQRVCVVSFKASINIVVASALAPMLESLWPFVSAIAGAGLLVALLFALLSRSVARRSLEPLARFEACLAALPGLGGERRVPAVWGAAEIDTLAQTFNELLARIDLAVEREQRFVADAAHELRTPLTRLRGQLELLLDMAGSANEVSERLALAARTCAELTRTTEVLLALARDEVSLQDAVDLGEVARGSVASLRPEARERVSCSIDDEALVRGDEALLSLVVVNLLENALKYTTHAVTLRVRAAAGQCVLAVEDVGAGVPEAELARVRERFVRGNARPTDARGTGLGLALVDHVARLHAGGLHLHNRAPQGLRAEVCLPAWLPSETERG